MRPSPRSRQMPDESEGARDPLRTGPAITIGACDHRPQLNRPRALQPIRLRREAPQSRAAIECGAPLAGDLTTSASSFRIRASPFPHLGCLASPCRRLSRRSNTTNKSSRRGPRRGAGLMLASRRRRRMGRPSLRTRSRSCTVSVHELGI